MGYTYYPASQVTSILLNSPRPAARSTRRTCVHNPVGNPTVDGIAAEGRRRLAMINWIG